MIFVFEVRVREGGSAERYAAAHLTTDGPSREARRGQLVVDRRADSRYP